MTLPKSVTTVTPLSKYLAMALFILFPFVGFYLGIQYQKLATPQYSPKPYISAPQITITPTPTRTIIAKPQISCRPRPACLDAKPRCMIAETSDMCPPSMVQKKFCTMEAKQCPDGSYVGRSGPNCEFEACPN